MVCSPGGGSEFWQPLDGCVGESGQDMGEVLTHRDLYSAACVDDGQRFATDWATCSQLKGWGRQRFRQEGRFRPLLWS